MSPFQVVITRYLRCVADAWQTLSQPRCLLPFALLSFIELFALTGYVFFAVPPFSAIYPGAMRALFGPEVLHYPEHILRLPDVMNWIRAGLGVVCGFFLLGWGLWLTDERLREGQRARDKRPRALIVPWFIAYFACALLLAAIVPTLDLLGELRVVGRLKPLWQGLGVLVRPASFALAAYAMFFALAGKTGNGFAALRHAARFMCSHWAETLLIALGAVVLASPFLTLAAQANWFVLHAHPGLVVASTLGAVLWDAVVRFYLFVSAVSLEMNRSEG